MTCPDCDGRGVLFRAPYDGADPGDAVERVCSTCKGAGNVEREPAAYAKQVSAGMRTQQEGRMSGHTSGRLTVHLSYLPAEDGAGSYDPPPPDDGWWPEEWTILRVLPECPARRCHGGKRLCDACWLLEHIGQCGLDYFTEPLEWDGRGKAAATIVVSGVLTFEETNNVNGHDYDESFDMISMDVLPPEPDPVDVEPEGGRVYGLDAWEEGHGGIKD